ncbi:MAG: hypothetical protein KGR16_06990 [Verrucomicrobia bacterium]|nr:hypothetical protein [Verrucomicrobiota bacterium]
MLERGLVVLGLAVLVLGWVRVAVLGLVVMVLGSVLGRGLVVLGLAVLVLGLAGFVRVVVVVQGSEPALAVRSNQTLLDRHLGLHEFWDSKDELPRSQKKLESVLGSLGCLLDRGLRPVLLKCGAQS